VLAQQLVPNYADQSESADAAEPPAAPYRLYFAARLPRKRIFDRFESNAVTLFSMLTALGYAAYFISHNVEVSHVDWFFSY
jgi:hypothetical protein